MAGLKVLVADDDAASRAVLRAALRKLGHECVEAADGKEAWEAYRREAPALVLADWMMPGLDGLELCRMIRAEPRARYPYIILVTSSEARGPISGAWTPERTISSASPSMPRRCPRGSGWGSASSDCSARSGTCTGCCRSARIAAGFAMLRTGGRISRPMSPARPRRPSRTAYVPPATTPRSSRRCRGSTRMTSRGCCLEAERREDASQSRWRGAR
jgi:Response regulator containing a CheY-like receiver domain and a GGDEF domain